MVQNPWKFFGQMVNFLLDFFSSVWGPAGLTYGVFCLTEAGELNPDFGQNGMFNHISIFPLTQYSLNDVWLSR